MFPIRDDNPHFLTPVVTYGLIAANVLAWLLLQGAGTEPSLSSSVCRLGLIPAELLQTALPGARFPGGPDTVCIVGDTRSWFTPLTSMFMHGGWFHLLGNMWFLWIFGNNVEDSMGHARFVLFYLLCGLAAAALQTLADPSSVIPMVGASGAIGGVWALTCSSIRASTFTCSSSSASTRRPSPCQPSSCWAIGSWCSS